MTVSIYVDTNVQVGDQGHLKVYQPKLGFLKTIRRVLRFNILIADQPAEHEELEDQ